MCTVFPLEVVLKHSDLHFGLCEVFLCIAILCSIFAVPNKIVRIWIRTVGHNIFFTLVQIIPVPRSKKFKIFDFFLEIL